MSALPQPATVPHLQAVPQPDEFQRLWRGCMGARVLLAVALLGLQVSFYAMGPVRSAVPLLVTLLYLAATVAMLLWGPRRRLGRGFDGLALATVGVDLAVFSLLQWLQGYGSVNYAPLLALPVLLCSVLGTLTLAMGLAACATLLLLGQALWFSYQLALDPAALYVQAALTGAGYFVIAFLATQVAARLAVEEQRSQRSQLAVRVQRQVNALVIEAMADGVLVVGTEGTVWDANPAARRLLGLDPLPPEPAGSFALDGHQGWGALRDLAMHSLAADRPQHANVVLQLAHGGRPQRVLVRTRVVAASEEQGAERLCVMFLRDQREMEARLRTEKLASMGRMSTAVAHEIRNPLAAIVQANALLDEDVAEPRLRQLTRMVQQNAQRLEKIVDDILDLSRAQGPRDPAASAPLVLDAAAARICGEWAEHNRCGGLLVLRLGLPGVQVAFDEEHLRRVLVNLLDNARRHASGQPGAIQVRSRWSSPPVAPARRDGADGEAPVEPFAVLGVWSDGPPMEPSVERHLFEPFFSSESRSTGLGLYLCRELCEGHGAAIAFERGHRQDAAGGVAEGNEFFVTFARAVEQHGVAEPSARIQASLWQPSPP